MLHRYFLLQQDRTRETHEDWGRRRAGRGVLVLVMMMEISLLPSPTSGANFSNYAALRKDLFTNYQKELRPVKDDSLPMDVYIAMRLSSIQELDEINQQLTFSAFFEVSWNDVNLQWNNATYNNIEYFTYPQKEVWIPDLTIRNSMESMKEMGFDRNYLFIRCSGEVTWIVGGVFKTSCDIDVTYYPFDTQECHVIISTLVSTLSEIDVSFTPDHSVSSDWYSESGSWDLLSFTVGSVADTSDRTLIAFTIKIKRLRLYHVVTILTPVLFLSLTATLVFALPADSGEKMGTSITVLLAFAVYLTIVAEQMPKTSVRVSIMAVYLTSLLGLTASGVLLTVWILNLHFRDDVHPPGPRLRKVVFLLRAIMCKGPEKSKDRSLRDLNL
ncbi:neuronal acetylcholine receptor subunit alpha-7-like [Babylonia areolata]|uniref:neuronal acetylcholine receptor subunit alpha-7-like n=1 Tax=Babylonia areolata TaxID=304850 RepID=UPI003FCFB68B